MNNYTNNHMLQFSSNVAGYYRFAVVADIVLSGSSSCIDQLRYFLNRALAYDVTNVLYLGSRLTHEDVVAWPRVPGLTTWCLDPQANHNGSRRDDLVPAPSGFVLQNPGKGYAVPIFLHYHPISPTFPRDVVNAGGGEMTAVHLVGGGGSDHGFQALPDGGVLVSVGTFPPVGAIVEFLFSGTGELECVVDFWEFTAPPPAPT